MGEKKKSPKRVSKDACTRRYRISRICTVHRIVPYFQKPFRERAFCVLSTPRFLVLYNFFLEKENHSTTANRYEISDKQDKRYKLIILSYFTLIYNIFEVQTKTINAHFPDRSNFIVHR